MKPLQTAPWVLVIAGLVLAGSARAQTLLRWKLEPGQALVVDFQQETTSTIAFSGKSAESKIELGMELLWTVTAADEQGIALTQSVRRVQFKLESAKAGVLQYDSAAKARPTGQAREVADAIKPLLGAEVAIVMTERGQIVSAKPANGAAEMLFAKDPAADQPGVFSGKAIETMLRHPLAILPEAAVAADGSWTSTSDLDAAAGKFKQSTTYRLAGTEERDGQKLARIELSSALEPSAAQADPAAASSKLKLKSHEQTGHILFSTELGRLVEARQKQKMTTERPFRETTIVVTLDSAQTTTIKPAK